MRTTGKRQSDLLLDAVDIFNADGIPYAVVGDFAAAVHGVDRRTKDMDVILRIALPSCLYWHPGSKKPDLPPR